jgi:hypothetical protein
MRAGISQLPILSMMALPLLAAVVNAFAQPADDAPGFSIEQGSTSLVSPLPPWTLAIRGLWPTRCPPTLENVALDDHDLRIDARSVLDLCERGATPFSIELNPALAVDHGVLSPGVYRISFYAADGAQAPLKLRAFALIDRSSQDAREIVPETGFWSSSNAEANAERTTLSLELQDGQLSVALLSYDDLGQPVWYFGAAPFAGRTAHLALLRLTGGSAPFAQISTAAPHGDSALTLDLEFASAGHASAWLTRTHGGADASLQVQTLDLVRLPLADSTDGHAWQGDWVLVTDAADAVPQRLHFEQYHAVDTAHFQLDDAAAKVALICSRKPAQPEWPPSSCSLHQDDGAVLGNFDSIALARMDGQREDLTGIHLLRVTR